MLRRAILFTLLIFSLFAPVLAQDDQATLQQPCTPEQRTQLIDLLRQVSATVPQSALDESDPALNAALTVLNFQTALETYQNQIAPGFPLCSDGLAMRDYWQVRLEREFARVVLASLQSYVLNYGVPAMSEPIDAQLDLEATAILTLPTVNDYLGIIGQGGLLLSGFPVCGERAAAELSKYDDLRAEYEALYPDFVEFMESVSGDFDALFQSEILAMEAFMVATEPCAENFVTEVRLVRMMTQTSLAIHLIQLAAFERNYGSATNAQALETLAQTYTTNVIALHQRLLNE